MGAFDGLGDWGKGQGLEPAIEPDFGQLRLQGN
jgi:hypothetical protein